MSTSDNEFEYTYLPADGVLAVLKTRFRVTDQGPQILDHDRSTVTKTPSPGDLLIIPKPKDIPFFQNADWQSFTAIGGEGLPALIKRAHTDSNLISKGRVMNPTAAMTPGYIWHDWQNAALRQTVLAAAPGNNHDAPEKDVSPTDVVFKSGTESVFLPLTPVKVSEAQVAPSTPGGAAPPATVDSDSDLAKLRAAIGDIEGALNRLASTRFQALQVQAQAQGWLEALKALRKTASDKSALLASKDDTTGKARQDFIDALGKLIDKASPPLLSSSVVKLAPDLIDKQFEPDRKFLLEQVQNPTTIALLAKVVPVKGAVPWVSGATFAETVLAQVCHIAARCAQWIADSAPRDTADVLLGDALVAMGSGSAPTDAAKNVIAFAVATPFYADRDLVKAAESAPAALAGAVGNAFIALQVAEQLVKGGNDPSANDRLTKVLEVQGKVMEAYGWPSWFSHMSIVAKAGWGSFDRLSRAYRAIAQKESPEAALAAEKEINAIIQQGASGFDGVAQVFQAKTKFGEVNVETALKALGALEEPATRFTELTSDLKTLGALAWNCNAALSDAAATTTAGLASKAAGSGIDLAAETLKSMNALKVVTSIESRELIVMLGRASLVFAAAAAAFDIAQAQNAKDALDKYGHLAMASSTICFLFAAIVGGVPGSVVIAVGTALFVGGEVLLSWRSAQALLRTDMEKAFDAILPAPVTPGSFEGICSQPIDLAAEISGVRATFEKSKNAFVDPEWSVPGRP